METPLRSQFRRPVLRIGTSVAAALLGLLWSAAITPVSGQAPTGGFSSFNPPLTSTGQPNLSGFWQALNTANWNIETHTAAESPHSTLNGAYLVQPPGFGVVVDGPIPYNEKGLARRKEHFAKRLTPEPLAVENEFPYDAADPEAKCFVGGVPRATYMPYPFQIIHGRSNLAFVYGFGSGAKRLIHLNKTFDNLLEIYDYPGQSVGRWDGTTLVVDTRWFNTNVWLDRAGNYYGENALVVERYTLVSPYHMMYEATITDPEVFTRPWTMRMPLYRIVEPAERLQIMELDCVPFVEDFQYGIFKKGVFKPPVPVF